MRDHRQQPTSTEADQLSQNVLNAFAATGYANMLQYVSVEVCGEVIVLSGRLPSYYLKQLAQTAAMTVACGIQVRNETHVI